MLRTVFGEVLRTVKSLRGLPWSQLVLSPLLTVVSLFVLWTAMANKSEDARQLAIGNGLLRAADLAHTFEQYTGRSVRQMDQITRFVAFEYQEHGKSTPLPSMMKDVLVSPATPALLSLADRNGWTYASSKPSFVPVSIADREHFIEARDHPEKGLVIGQSIVGRVSGQETVQITRRLTDPDGSFGGVVVVSMAPEAFTNFYNKAEMGKLGFVGIVGLDGRFRATRLGDHAPDLQRARNPDVLTQPMGSYLAKARDSSDGQARFVSWRRLDGYDLVALVGISEQEVMAPFYAQRRELLRTGLATSIALLAIGLLTTLLHARVVRRRLDQHSAEEAYRTASEGTQDGFFIAQALRDSKGWIYDFLLTDTNDRGAQMMGVSKAMLTHSRLSTWFPGEDGQRLIRQYAHALNQSRVIDQPEVLVECDNALRGHWYSHRAVPAAQGLAITLRDITQIKTHESSLRWLAEHDSVTQLHNRAWLQTRLPEELRLAQEAQSHVALFFVDLDDFKKVNDTLGHAAGDQLLREVGERLRRIAGECGDVCRLGGDEFTVVARGTFTPAHLRSIGSQILEALAQPLLILQQTVSVGASVGVSCFPEHGQDATTLLRQADLAMYHAKEKGKGALEFFRPQLAADAQSRLSLERDLRHALATDQLFLAFQPKIALRNRQFNGMEALVRWNCPGRGLVPPMEFIDVAERTGLIVQLGDIVLDKACAQIAIWREKGLSVPPVSINVSARQLHRVDIAASIAQALERYQLPASAIEVEITESCMMEDPDQSYARLRAIKELGVRILVDDFGTGYSSLAQLKRFEVDVIKVDRSFVKGIPHNPEDSAILQAIVSMAQTLNMEVVAEGIETLEQETFLNGMDCDEGQGFLFSKPLSPEDLSQWLRPASLASTPSPTLLPSTPKNGQHTPISAFSGPAVLTSGSPLFSPAPPDVAIVVPLESGSQPERGSSTPRSTATS